jgi:nudix-type nucleoside diphosphatase (YffH/AdpP family)
MAVIVETKKIHEGWATLLQATIRAPDGETFERLIEDHGTAVSVLPYDSARATAVLVRQFRPPVNLASGQEDLLEAIAGRIERAANEDAQSAAIREAFEEAGLRLTALEFVSDCWTMPGISTERTGLFLACYSEGDRIPAGGGHPDEHENITVVEIPLRELAVLADSGKLNDLKTFALVQSLRLRQPSLFA